MQTLSETEFYQAIKEVEGISSKLKDSAAQVYFSRLKNYTHQQVANAMQKLVMTWQKSTFPPIGEVIKTIDESKPVPTGSGRSNAWEKRKSDERKNIRKMVDDYVLSRKNGTIMLQAKAEGWDWMLERYVRTCAAVQAQYIAGVAHVGYSAMDVFISYPPTDEQVNQFIESQKSACAMGEINVKISTAHVDYWRKIAQKPTHGASYDQSASFAKPVGTYHNTDRKHFERKAPQEQSAMPDDGQAHEV